MIDTLELWYPNYRNNPGIVSKELKSQISEMIKHFDISVEGGMFEGFEKFILTINYENEEYLPYVRSLLHKKFGQFINPKDLQVGTEYRGRLISPGRVGFGIFADIGIRANNKHQDVLIPLYQLREDLQMPDTSTREIVRQLGFIDGLPVIITITEIERDPGLKITTRLSAPYIDQLLEWSEISNERLFVTKTLQSNITNALKNTKLQPYIDEISPLDPLTTILTCSKKTHASGILPRLGAQLSNAPLGIFHPTAINHILD